MLVAPLLTEGAEGVQTTIDLLDAYGLSKDDLSENLKELQLVIEKSTTPGLQNQFDSLDPKVKAALTRLYNQGEHRAQALVSEQAVTTKGKRKRQSDDEDGDLLGHTIEDLDAVIARGKEGGGSVLSRFYSPILVYFTIYTHFFPMVVHPFFHRRRRMTTTKMPMTMLEMSLHSLRGSRKPRLQRKSQLMQPKSKMLMMQSLRIIYHSQDYKALNHLLIK
jgi:hypothetical protein